MNRRKDGGGGDGSGAAADGRRKAVTLKDMARELDLSPTTISLVLNRSPVAQGLAEETRRRVLQAAREMGYRPNYMARALRSQRSFSIGVLVRDVVDSYAAAVLAGLESFLVREGYVYLLASHQSRADLRDDYLQILLDRSVEGFVLVNTTLSDPPPLPAVSVSGHQLLDGVVNLVVDHAAAAAAALGHLTSLGHRRIAFFKGQPDSADTEDRWQSIVDAARSLGLALEPELVLQLGTGAGNPQPGAAAPDWPYEEGYRFGARLARRQGEFTALFAFDDTSALGAMRAFQDAGLVVPDDVSVVGFDDIPSAAYHNPKLTTVRQPLWRMGETAGEILLKLLAGTAAYDDFVTVEPELIVRASTGPARDGGAGGP